MENKGQIVGINGSVVKVGGNPDLKMLEMVKVGNLKLTGEVIAVHGGHATVQVYEDTVGLSVKEPVMSTGESFCVELGPGILRNIFDGIERPLQEIEKASGAFIKKGLNIQNLSREIAWEVKILVKKGDRIQAGDIIATVQETSLITHKIMVPDGITGEVTEALSDGSYPVDTAIVQYKNQKDEIKPLTMIQKWPIRVARPVKRRKSIEKPLVTGQRIIDSLFPVAKGGTAAIPGGFGTGKTMTQHQFAKWSDADIIVYIGCGERGNEMTEVLEDFTKLVDPKSQKPLMDRTVLIANTSNMPVAAREASIYTGITIAEYYRDMGYDVAIMADSTSRWAEALREISGRLEEMPAEEGFPAYLSSRLSEFYERAGSTVNLNETEGSVTIIGAVSPQGGDFSEPVTQNTKRFVRCFLALDRQLAYGRHYPAINWLLSYSEYLDDLGPWYEDTVSSDFLALRTRMIKLLNEENELMEIVKLVGDDVLPDNQKLTLLIAKIVRTGFLQQNAYHANDTFVPIEKQYEMMKTILFLYDACDQLVGMGIPVAAISSDEIFNRIVQVKYDIANEELQKFEQYRQDISAFRDKFEKSYENVLA